MISIKIEIPKNEVKQDTACLIKAVDKAITRSLDKTFVSTRAEWARMIHQELYLSIGTIKSAIGQKKSGDSLVISVSTSDHTFAAPGGKSSAKTPGMPLKYFTPKQTRKGVSVAVKRKSGRQTIPHAFMWRGHVWRRAELVGYKGRNVKRKHFKSLESPDYSALGLVGRLPIDLKYTTAIEDVAADHLSEIEKFAQKRLDVVFSRQFEYELSKC